MKNLSFWCDYYVFKFIKGNVQDLFWALSMSGFDIEKIPCCHGNERISSMLKRRRNF